jgi:hypothetical protein
MNDHQTGGFHTECKKCDMNVWIKTIGLGCLLWNDKVRPKDKSFSECQCEERQKTKGEESTQMKTRLIVEKFVSVMGDCVTWLFNKWIEKVRDKDKTYEWLSLLLIDKTRYKDKIYIWVSVIFDGWYDERLKTRVEESTFLR